jgi:hypothetical protein
MAEPSDGEQDVRNLTDSLAEIRDLMAQGRFEEAMKRLEQLNQETQEMMAAMQNELEGLKAPSEEAQAALSQLDQTLDRLVDEQSGLHGETQEVDKQRLRRQADKLQEALAEARAVAKQVSAQLNATSETGLHPSDSEALETNRRHSAELQMTLDRGEVESARRQAVGMRDGLKALGKEVSESESREEDDTRLEALRDTRRGLEKATGLATRLTELLEQLDTPSEPLSPNERRQTSRLEARQKRLARELGKLERTLEEVEAQSPELRAELEPIFQQASESMERARAELSRRGIKPAAQHQRDALDQMGQAKGQIERHIRQTPRRQGRGSVGLNRPDQKVEIPDSESFRSSSQLRDELLKAMGERAPEAYEEAIDQYYEELVK